MFMQAYIQKLKPKLKFTVSLIVVMLAIVFIKPIEAKADSGSMTENDPSGKGTTTVVGGPNWDHTGMLFYLVSPDGEQVSSTQAITTNKEGIKDRNGKVLPSNNIRLRSRLGIEPTEIMTNANALWGPPYKDAVFYGDEIEQWLLKPTETGHARAYNLIASTPDWGEAWAKKWERKEVYVCFEPFYWHHIYKNGVGTGIWFCGTTYSLGSVQAFMSGEGMGADGTGDTLIKRYTNDYYGNCIIMDDREEIRNMGFVPASHGGLLTNKELYASRMGWGIGVVWNEQDAIHTYWEDSPGDPEPPDASDPPKSGDCAMVKSYYIEYRKNGRLDRYENKGTYYQKECTNVISIDDEPNYKLERWAISTATADTSIVATNNEKRVTWLPRSVTQGGEHPEIKTLQGDEQVVYVLLKKVVEEEITPTPSTNINYTLKESQITKRISLSTQDGAALSSKLSEHTFTWNIVAHTANCSGHDVEDWIACDGSCKPQIGHDHAKGPCNNDDSDKCTSTYSYGDACGKKHKSSKDVYCSDFTNLTDKDLTLGITNTLKDEYPNILATEWRKVTNGETTNVSTTRTSTSAQNFSKTGWDWIGVLMRGKDKLTVANWKGQGTELKAISSSGFSVADTPQGTRKTQDYYDKFSAKFTGRTDVDLETVATATKKGEGYDGEPCTDTKKLTFLDSTVLALNDISVLVETYSGTPEGEYNDTTVGENQVQSKTISFYPYIKMRYDKVTDTNKTAYVLGQYQRSITPNDYAQVSISGSPEKIDVESHQWSTHAGAQAILGDLSYLGVLPGGATLTISTPETKTVTVTTYQCILMGDGETQVNKTGGSKGRTKSEAESAHNSLVASVKSKLDEVEVVQHLQKSDGSKDSIIRPGTDLSDYSLLTGKASEDFKYYFRSDVDEISQGDIDVVSSEITSTSYVFSSDTEGNIKMNGDIILTKSETASSLSGTAETINKKTLVVDKLVKAIERNTGDDSEASWATDGKWYNEAFDGVTVLKQVTTIQVKLDDPPERMSVLDPKLTPKSTGKSDMFNKNKYMISYYKTENIGYIGTFRGKVKLSLDTSKLFKSKSFLIPNVTTQDLN